MFLFWNYILYFLVKSEIRSILHYAHYLCPNLWHFCLNLPHFSQACSMIFVTDGVWYFCFFFCVELLWFFYLILLHNNTTPYQNSAVLYSQNKEINKKYRNILFENIKKQNVSNHLRIFSSSFFKFCKNILIFSAGRISVNAYRAMIFFLPCLFCFCLPNSQAYNYKV